jgi:hypothetical protein
VYAEIAYESDMKHSKRLAELRKRRDQESTRQREVSAAKLERRRIMREEIATKPLLRDFVTKEDIETYLDNLPVDSYRYIGGIEQRLELARLLLHYDDCRVLDAHKELITDIVQHSHYCRLMSSEFDLDES